MKRNRVKILSLMVTSVLVITALSGCGSKKSVENKKIGMVVSTLNNPYFVKMRDEAVIKAKALGYDLSVVDSNNDASKERSNVDDLIQKGVAAIIINPTDSDAVGNAVKAANKSKIPVITVDRKANSGNTVCQITSDNVKGGEMAADFIAKQLKEKGTIVQIEGIPGASATRDRGNGFRKGIAKYPNMKIIASQSANFDRQKALDVMQNIMQSTPKFDAVFTQNDEMVVGASKALKGKLKPIIVGFDGNADAQALVKSGDITATVAQQPGAIADMAIVNADKIIKGKTVDKDVKIPVKMFIK
ncbi:D-ribose ABC transporter substrate-binding protein [Clostridium psychrophilum]|uniref:D-ribose ABC transporter substrate-binding protein n=1 Tax=Clostridium psychrophilum TaxID=132926 RepID=UPI001C0D10E6|nr:D-ribose ABC transporter substrate-binding protein [Clostridium psychrophilum]MBU3181980.1 D-ribose ABC transporter substrate-binding protein [Clostridium psychrophilum]